MEIVNLNSLVENGLQQSPMVDNEEGSEPPFRKNKSSVAVLQGQASPNVTCRQP